MGRPKTSIIHRRRPLKPRGEHFNDRQRRLGFRLGVWLAGWAAWLLLRVMMLTTRLTYIGREHFMAYQGAGLPCIYACWHRDIPYLFYYARGFHLTIMASRSDDGALAAELVRRSRNLPIRGSSSNGGREALEEMEGYVSEGYMAAIICDGPRGPALECKPGALRLAQRTGTPLLPLVVSAKRHWRLRSWDRMMFPRPFSPVLMICGEPVRVPPDLSAQEFENLRHRFSSTMRELTRRADMWLEDADIDAVRA